MRYTLVLIAVLITAAVAAWQAETRAALDLRLLLRTTTVHLAPYGELSYGTTRAHFWNSGSVDDLRFLPSPALRRYLDWRGEEPLHVRRLDYRHWQHDQLMPAALELQFDDATLPLAAPWPTHAAGALRWRYRAATRELDLGATIDAAESAALELALTLRLASPGRLGSATLLGGKARYRDKGLAQARRAALGLTAGADPESVDAAFAGSLLRWLSERGLPADADLQKAIRKFADDPMSFTAVLDPPGALQPETLGQFARADRVTALGLSLDVP